MAHSVFCIVVLLSQACGGGGGGDDDDPGGGGGSGSDAAGGSGADSAPAVDSGGGGGSDAGGGGAADGPVATTGEPPELIGITEAHNMVRAAHGVGPIMWDPQLASIAQAWVNQCIDTMAPAGLLDADPNRSTAYGSYVGENIFGSTGTVSGPEAVGLWAEGEADYDYANNTCASGGSCGAYTQIVWAASTKLGCAAKMCSGITYGYSIVCNYAPGGNDGNRPY